MLAKFALMSVELTVRNWAAGVNSPNLARIRGLRDAVPSCHYKVVANAEISDDGSLAAGEALILSLSMYPDHEK
jgi:hypothetical protein